VVIRRQLKRRYVLGAPAVDPAALPQGSSLSTASVTGFNVSRISSTAVVASSIGSRLCQ
jgi:hypothetical protein